MKRSAWVVVGVLALVVGCGAWVWFLVVQGLERADQWSSVVSGVVGVVGLVVALVSLVVAVRARGTTASATPAGPPTVDRSVRMRDNHGTVNTGENTTFGGARG